MIAYTEALLVMQLQQGNTKAFQQLQSRYNEALLGSILLLVKDPMDAQDLLQDTYVKVWQRFRSYDPERGRLFTWLLQIARNTAIDYLRWRTPINTSLEPDAMLLTYCHWPVTDTIEVKALVKRVLSPLQWQVIDLAYWHGYTQEEIAGRLAMPLGTVKSRIRKSLMDLRFYFDPD